MDASKPSVRYLPLENNQAFGVFYRVRFSDKSFYSISPSKGYVEPNSCVMLKIESLKNNTVGLISKLDVDVKVNGIYSHHFEIILHNISTKNQRRSSICSQKDKRTTIYTLNQLCKMLLMNIKRNLFDIFWK